MQGALEFLISNQLQIFQGIFSDCFKSVNIWQKYGHESVARFLAHPVHIRAWPRVLYCESKNKTRTFVRNFGTP